MLLSRASLPEELTEDAFTVYVTTMQSWVVELWVVGDITSLLVWPVSSAESPLFNCLGRGRFQDEILYFAPTASGYRKSHASLY